MKTLKSNEAAPTRVLVSALCRAALGDEAVHLVTREAGDRVRACLEGRLAALAPGGVLTIDFEGAGVIDFSCADECLAKLVSRLIAGEYADRYLCLAGLTDSQRENIQVALERRRVPAFLLAADGSGECLGSVTPYLLETLRLVLARGRVSAREMAGLLGLELTASSTRLINLHRLRLVTRRERVKSEGGREFVYQALVPPRRQEPREDGGAGHG